MEEENLNNIAAEGKSVEQVSIGDMETKTFVKCRLGETVEYTIEKIQKEVTPESEYNLSGVDYHYNIITTENQIHSITAWKLWNAIREALVSVKNKIGQNDPKGIRIKISHPARESYEVTVLKVVE